MRRAAAASLRRSLGLFRLSFDDNLQAFSVDGRAGMEINWAARCCRGYATRAAGDRPRHSDFSSDAQHQARNHCGNKAVISPEVQQDNQAQDFNLSSEVLQPRKKGIGENISSKDKNKFLLNTIFDLKDSKEAVYGALDAWVAWERNFPLVQLKRALITLEKEEQWHRVVQVIKWMLSKGQGTTMGSYEQLIRALEKDHRAEEAHKIWVKKIGHDLHSVPWRVCDLMISIYYRNNMLERLVKLFKGLESYDRKPPSKSVVRKVADAYEMLGLLEEKNRVLEKYSDLFCESSREDPRKSRKALKKLEKKTGERKAESSEASDDGSAACAIENVKVAAV